LDETDAQLQSTVAVLRNTPVEASLQPSPALSQSPGSSTSSAHVPEGSKHLYDFVDDTALAALHATLRACIDQYNAARTALVDTAETLDIQLNDINAAVASAKLPSSSLASSNRSITNSADLPGRPHASEPKSLPAIFRALESHATEAADLLQSLVRHYDLCVTALKHTEGGGQAVAAELGLGAGDEGADSVLQSSGEDPDAPHAPLTHEERVDMMAVLDKDAAEVDDVVNEIRDRLSEMETLLSSMQAATDSRRVQRADLMQAARLIQTLAPPATDDEGDTAGASVAVEAAAAFATSWAEERERILQARAELQGLADFYEGFAAAYDDLLIEVARRAEVRKKMEKVAREATVKLDKLAKGGWHPSRRLSADPTAALNIDDSDMLQMSTNRVMPSAPSRVNTSPRTSGPVSLTPRRGTSSGLSRTLPPYRRSRARCWKLPYSGFRNAIDGNFASANWDLRPMRLSAGPTC
jgi:autophagy-related protein 17